ncbi:MAG: tail fiber protein [Fimbriimonadaceae bacterium]
MATPFIGEIRVVGFNFNPVGWARCDGQLLPIAQFDALFALIGTTYGGDGQNTFALPDLRGRTMVGMGNLFIGESLGVESVTLTSSNLPTHTHTMRAGSAGTLTNPTQGVQSSYVGGSRADRLYATTASGVAATGMLETSGGNQPHENRMPYQAVLCVIALEGIFPPRN